MSFDWKKENLMRIVLGRNVDKAFRFKSEGIKLQTNSPSESLMEKSWNGESDLEVKMPIGGKSKFDC